MLYTFVVANGLYPTGGPKRLALLYEEIKKADFDSRFISMHPVGTSEFLHKGKPAPQYRTYCVFFRDVFRNAFVSRFGRGVFIVRNMKTVAAVLPICKIFFVPIVWDVGIESQSKAGKFLRKFLVKFVAGVITQSNAQAKALFGESMVRKGKCRSVLPAIQDIKAASKSLNSHEYILSVGTIHPRKGHHRLIEALSYLRRKNIELWIAGDIRSESYLSFLKQTASEFDVSERVKYLGWVDDIAGLIQGSLIVALLSDSEGVPNCIQEAMYIGKTVITSKVGGLPEIIEDQTNGFLVETGEIHKVAHLIDQLLNDKENRLRIEKQAYDYARKNFSPDRWARRYLLEVNTIIGA